MSDSAPITCFADAVRVFGKTEEADPVIGLARQLYADSSDDDIEVDDVAVVSYGEHGAWVSGWVFVSNQALRRAGIVNPEDPEAPIEGDDDE
jgi:hypothetical protein